MAKTNGLICVCMTDNYDAMARRNNIPNNERCPSCIVLPADYDPESFTLIEKVYEAALDAWREAERPLKNAADALATAEMLLTKAKRTADALIHQSIASDEYKKAHNELSHALREVAVAHRRLNRAVKAVIPTEDECDTAYKDYQEAKALYRGYTRQRPGTL